MGVLTEPWVWGTHWRSSTGFFKPPQCQRQSQGLLDKSDWFLFRKINQKEPQNSGSWCACHRDTTTAHLIISIASNTPLPSPSCWLDSPLSFLNPLTEQVFLPRSERVKAATRVGADNSPAVGISQCLGLQSEGCQLGSAQEWGTMHRDHPSTAASLSPSRALQRKTWNLIRNQIKWAIKILYSTKLVLH